MKHKNTKYFDTSKFTEENLWNIKILNILIQVNLQRKIYEVRIT